ncbi:MAG TPA: hypothetical protein VKR30_08185 [Candidatus Limnocylindrales bacterium]|nr:hypothetical protein [Candidatus Limnocylindrales bacterium]
MTEPTQPTEPAAPTPAAPAGWSAPAPAAPMAAAGGARPTGATVITIIAGIEGVLIVLFGLLAILGMSLIGGIVGSSGTANAGAAGGFLAGLGIVIAIIVFVIGALYLLIAFGMWNARRWSWTLGAVVYVIALVFGVLGLAGGVSVYSLIIGIVLPAVVLFFLWQPDVKRYLGRG